MTPAGIEPAQHLNHCATAVPFLYVVPPFKSRQIPAEAKIFSLLQKSSLALGTTQPPIQGECGPFPRGVQQQRGEETTHLHLLP